MYQLRKSKLLECKLGIKLFKNSPSGRLKRAKTQKPLEAVPLDPLGNYNASQNHHLGATTLCAVADKNVQTANSPYTECLTEH